jgi:rhodanese-related sulfurtransferase
MPNASHRAIKDRLFAQFARIGKTVASPTRVELLDLLSQGEKPVEVLAAQAEASIKNTSAHLRELRLARLVETRREGTRIFYRLADPDVFQFLRTLQALARKQIAELEQVMKLYLEGRDSLEPVTAEELLRRMRRKEVTVLDVRPADEYRQGHVPGALSVPVAELERRLGDLSKRKEIVAYCRGPYCLFAIEAVEILRTRGFRVRRLSGGLPDWASQGFPVALGARS